MIHAVCDFCGHDCGRTANMLTVTPFQNFARYDTDSEPYGASGPKRSFVICQTCMQKHGIPNPYHHYHKLNSQEVAYAKSLNTYTETDLKDDIRADKKGSLVQEDPIVKEILEGEEPDDGKREKDCSPGAKAYA